LLDIFFVNHKINLKVLLSEKPFPFEKALLHGACCASLRGLDLNWKYLKKEKTTVLMVESVSVGMHE